MDELQEIALNVYRLAQEASVEDFQPLALDLVRDVLPFDTCRWGSALASTSFAGGHRYAGQPAHAPVLDYLCLVRNENLLVTGVVFPSKVAKSWSFERADRHHFSERERQVSETVFPHLMQALSINLKLDLARFKDNVGPVRWPMAMCNCDGLLLHAEAEFSALLAEQWPQTAPRWLPHAVIDSLLVRRKRHCLAERVLVCLSERVGSVVYLKARPRQTVDGLTERELQVARLVARGMSFKEVAAALNMAPATARNHIQHIHERLAIRSNAELASKLADALPG